MLNCKIWKEWSWRKGLNGRIRRRMELNREEESSEDEDLDDDENSTGDEVQVMIN